MASNRRFATNGFARDSADLVVVTDVLIYMDALPAVFEAAAQLAA